jgi:hypothetical protein
MVNLFCARHAQNNSVEGQFQALVIKFSGCLWTGTGLAGRRASR